MAREGRAAAPAAGTILNALASGIGGAFAIDREIRASVRLDDRDQVEGAIVGAPETDTSLIERCVERTLAAVPSAGISGGTVRTESAVPAAAGLKSSSAAANATVLATLDALGEAGTLDRVEAARIGVEAARDTGVTVTGAFDDATASMLGGITVTDNSADTILTRDTMDWEVAVWTPPNRTHSAEVSVERCQRLAPIADLIADQALAGEYTTAMTVNGFAFCAALERSPEPMLEALPGVAGVSLSGTGPSFTAVGPEPAISRVADQWANRDGSAWTTSTRTQGATVL